MAWSYSSISLNFFCGFWSPWSLSHWRYWRFPGNVENRNKYLHTNQNNNEPFQEIRFSILKNFLEEPNIVLQWGRYAYKLWETTWMECMRKLLITNKKEIQCTSTNFSLKSRLPNLWVSSYSSLRYSHIWA